MNIFQSSRPNFQPGKRKVEEMMTFSMGQTLLKNSSRFTPFLSKDSLNTLKALNLFPTLVISARNTEKSGKLPVLRLVNTEVMQSKMPWSHTTSKKEMMQLMLKNVTTRETLPSSAPTPTTTACWI